MIWIFLILGDHAANVDITWYHWPCIIGITKNQFYMAARIDKIVISELAATDQTGTGHQKSLAEKAKPVLKRAYARTKTGTRSETGSARTSTGLLLIRVLTHLITRKIQLSREVRPPPL